MPLLKLILSYDGTPYNGWQIQPTLPTVQGTLAAAIRQITGESVLPQGSGRTDTGVHALAQVATFELASPIPIANLHHALNRALPPSIRVLSVELAPPGFHARHSARRKTYEYRIFPRGGFSSAETDNICSPMLAPFVWDCPWPLDFAAMQSVAPAILGEHDFTSFAASDPDQSARDQTTCSRSVPGLPTSDQSRHSERSGESPHSARSDDNLSGRPHSTIRRIDASLWIERDGLFVYRVTGSGFLHHMVRNLVGTFVDIGAHRIPADAIPSILAARDRSAAGPTAPARGLFLTEVIYF